MDLQNNCMHIFEDNICKTCGVVKLDENGLSKERNKAIEIMEWLAEYLGNEEIFDCKDGGTTWYDVEDKITSIIRK